MTHRVRLPRRAPTAGDVLASLPAQPSSVDIWAAERVILRLSPGERAHLRYALASCMGFEEYRACWAHPLGGRLRPEPAARTQPPASPGDDRRKRPWGWAG